MIGRVLYLPYHPKTLQIPTVRSSQMSGVIIDSFCSKQLPIKPTFNYQINFERTHTHLYLIFWEKLTAMKRYMELVGR